MRNLWNEVNEIKSINNHKASNIDSIDTDEGRSNIFLKKYEHLYNSVPSDVADMQGICNELSGKILAGSDGLFKISINQSINQFCIIRLGCIHNIDNHGTEVQNRINKIKIKYKII